MDPEHRDSWQAALRFIHGSNDLRNSLTRSKWRLLQALGHTTMNKKNKHLAKNTFFCTMEKVSFWNAILSWPYLVPWTHWFGLLFQGKISFFARTLHPVLFLSSDDHSWKWSISSWIHGKWNIEARHFLFMEAKGGAARKVLDKIIIFGFLLMVSQKQFWQ